MNNILDDNRPNRPTTYYVELGILLIVGGLTGFAAMIHNPQHYMQTTGRFVLDIVVFSFTILLGYKFITAK